MEKADVILCMDIGGTNCRMGLCGKDYTLYEKQIISTERMAERDFRSALTEAIRTFLADHEPAYTICGISLGFPATIDRERRVVLQAPAIRGASGLAICDMLEQEFHRKVWLEKDVNLLFLYDLMTLGLPRKGLSIGVYFGTGIGNAIFFDGKPFLGHNGVAGELGHIPQLSVGRRCDCGNIGCLEPFGGGKRLAELCRTDFKGTAIKTIYRTHGEADQVLRQIDAMAIAVATEVNILDPDHVVLGGGLLQMDGFPTEMLEERIKAYVRKPYPEKNLCLLYSRPNQENGIIGAGIYGWEALSASLS